MYYLFAYGTLRSCCGEINQRYLSKSRFVGLGYIEGFNMYLIDYYPGIVEGNGKVIGEVYEVHDLKEIDEYEGYNESGDSLYVRILTRVYFGSNRLTLDDVYVYKYNKSVRGLKRIENGDFCFGKQVFAYFLTNKGLIKRYSYNISPLNRDMVKVNDNNGNVYFAFVDR